jgi:hypothetical protein
MEKPEDVYDTQSSARPFEPTPLEIPNTKTESHSRSQASDLICESENPDLKETLLSDMRLTPEPGLETLEHIGRHVAQQNTFLS